MYKFLLTLLELIRFWSFAGFLLLFFPCAFGTLLATKDKAIQYMFVFLFGSIFMRGAGCIVNDLLDRDIDKFVQRTKNRLITSGVVSVKKALMIVAMLILFSAPIAFMLHWKAFVISILSLILAALYPLMKRFTYFPQLFLGIVFNIGFLISYIGISNECNVAILCGYAGCIFWTLGYDTIYAFMDLEDDVKIGVKSLAIFLHENSFSSWLIVFYTLFIVLMTISAVSALESAKLIILMTALAAGAICLWQVITLDISSQKNCLIRFKSNIYVGLIWTLGLICARFSV